MPSHDYIKKAIQDGWDEMSESYQAETRISLDDIHYGPLAPGERELGLLGDVRGKRVLELACGAAQNSIVLAKWGASVTAIDFSPKQLETARSLVAQEEVAVNLIRGDIERLDMFRDGLFDIVLSSYGWEFVPDLQTCFSECARALKPGGLLVVCTVHPLSAFEWDETEKGLMVTDYFNLPVEVWDEPTGTGNQKGLTFFHTVQNMFDMLTESGFLIERIIEPYPYSLEDMAETDKAAIPYAGPYWESQYERFKRIPFAIIYKARKP